MLGDVYGGADVFTFADDQLLALAAGGVLEPINSPDEIKKANVESSVEAATIGEQLYAYPLTADNGYFMYYNKKYLDETDVVTLDSVLEKAELNNKLVTMDWTSGWYLYSFFGNTGLTIGLNDDGVTNYCDWNSTTLGVKGIDVAKAMLSIASSEAFKSVTDDIFMEGVKDGSIIAGVSGVWNAKEIANAWGDDYAAVKLPTYTCNGKQIQMSSYAGYKMIGVNSYSTNVEWATKLAEWISNEENQTLRFIERGQGPANINAAASDEVMKSPAIQAVIQQSEYASLQRIGSNYWDPISNFGLLMSKKNASGNDLQKLLDTLVKGITASIAQ